ICMEVRDVRSQDNRVLECMHVFHKECIDKWFQESKHRTCPTCRNEDRSANSRTFGGESNVASRRSTTTFQATNAVFSGPPNSADPRNVTFSGLANYGHGRNPNSTSTTSPRAGWNSTSSRSPRARWNSTFTRSPRISWTTSTRSTTAGWNDTSNRSVIAGEAANAIAVNAFSRNVPLTRLTTTDQAASTRAPTTSAHGANAGQATNATSILSTARQATNAPSGTFDQASNVASTRSATTNQAASNRTPATSATDAGQDTNAAEISATTDQAASNRAPPPSATAADAGQPSNATDISATTEQSASNCAPTTSATAANVGQTTNATSISSTARQATNAPSWTFEQASNVASTRSATTNQAVSNRAPTTSATAANAGQATNAASILSTARQAANDNFHAVSKDIRQQDRLRQSQSIPSRRGESGRKPNFSKQEISTLLSIVAGRRPKTKNDWNSVAQDLNRQYPTAQRTGEGCRRKYLGMVGLAHQKANQGDLATQPELIRAVAIQNSLGESSSEEVDRGDQPATINYTGEDQQATVDPNYTGEDQQATVDPTVGFLPAAINPSGGYLHETPTNSCGMSQLFLTENRRKNDRELQWKHRIQREVAELKSMIETALLEDSQLYTVLQVHPQLGNIHNSN
ncbi:MAG: RING finger domain-containing protein, partial [bacterium]